jgi:hypothetical protein
MEERDRYLEFLTRTAPSRAPSTTQAAPLTIIIYCFWKRWMGRRLLTRPSDNREMISVGNTIRFIAAGVG